MSLYRIDILFNYEKGILQSSKCVPGEYDFITASSDWKTHNEYSFDCEALIFAAAASGSLGRTHYVKGKFISSDLCFILTPKDQDNLPIDLKFYHIIFNELKKDIVKNTKAGTSKEAIGLNAFGKYELPYYHIKRQIHIKNLYTKLFYLKVSINSELTHQQDLVKQLRQSFLREAMQGKLVKQDPKDEPASELLKKIKAEKEKLISEKKIKKEKPLPEIKEEEIPFEIPENWVWCRLGEIVQHNSGKTLDSGRNKGKLREYITTSNLYWGNFEIGNLKKMLIEDEELERCTAIKGDLLICEGGEAGRAAIWDNDSEVCFQNHIHRIRPFGKIKSIYLYWFFSFLNLSGEINKHRKGMGISNLSGKSLSLIGTPLPPLPEQHRIVSKLDELMKFCDELEKSIQQSKEQTEMLLQSSLREALRPEGGDE